jgi:hypothetical protein
MAQIGVQSTLVLVSSECGFEGCDLDEMSSVEYLCSGSSAVEDRLLSQGCQAEPDSMSHHFSGTSFVVVRKYGGSSGADPSIHETFTTSGYRGMVT